MDKTKLPLLEETLDLLKRRPHYLTYTIISTKTGLSQAWIKSFAVRKIDNPSITRVQRLNDYLKLAK